MLPRIVDCAAAAVPGIEGTGIEVSCDGLLALRPWVFVVLSFARAICASGSSADANERSCGQRESGSSAETHEETEQVSLRKWTARGYARSGRHFAEQQLASARRDHQPTVHMTSMVSRNIAKTGDFKAFAIVAQVECKQARR